jgi:hypothetical protein
LCGFLEKLYKINAIELLGEERLFGWVGFAAVEMEAWSYWAYWVSAKFAFFSIFKTLS